MATDAWQTAKTGIARLFGRSGPEQQAAIKAQLGRNATQVEQAEDADRARQRLAASWEPELESLLAEDTAYPRTAFGGDLTLALNQLGGAEGI